MFAHPDGKMRRVPPDWEWPKISIAHAYVYWHCGDLAKKISPMKILDKKDFAGQWKKRGVRTEWELRRLMGMIDNTELKE